MEKEKKLVLEGADCSGKSTIANILRQRYPKLDIADRSFISDRVYAQKFNRQTYLGVPIVTYLDYWEQWHKNNLDVRVILFTAKASLLASRAIEKQEQFCRNRSPKDVENYLSIDNQAFISTANYVCERLQMPLLMINTNNTIENTLERIEAFIHDEWL